jgi:hypothetical protein
MQATRHLDTLSWATRWVTQVIRLRLMLSTPEHLNTDPSQIVLSRQLRLNFASTLS